MGALTPERSTWDRWSEKFLTPEQKARADAAMLHDPAPAAPMEAATRCKRCGYYCVPPICTKCATPTESTGAKCGGCDGTGRTYIGESPCGCPICYGRGTTPTSEEKGE